MVDSSAMTIPMISEKSVNGLNLAQNETLFTGYNNMLQKQWHLKIRDKLS